MSTEEPLILPPEEMAAVRRVAAALGIAGQRPCHQAMRGDDVEAWLERWRAAHEDDLYPYAFNVIDDMLDDYREKADTGAPLDAALTGRDEREEP